MYAHILDSRISIMLEMPSDIDNRLYLYHVERPIKCKIFTLTPT